MISLRQGDLFASDLTALAHGVNCRGVMGAGIAAEFRRRWPDMYEVYRAKCELGSLRPGEVFLWEDMEGRRIFNLATQQDTGRDARAWAITTAIGQMMQLAIAFGVPEVGLPMIGCGIGGLREDVFWSCLEPFRGAPVNLTVFQYSPEHP